MASPALDIVVASYGEPGTSDPALGLCLESIEAFTGAFAYRVIVERSLASAAANRNRALERSDAEFVCFLDDDAWVTEGWCEGLLGFLEANPEVSMVGPKLKLEDGRIFALGIGYQHPFKFYPIAQNRPDAAEFDTTSRPFALPTTCLVLRRQALDEAGHFDEGFQSCQWEDLDQYLRLKLAGHAGALLGAVTVYHANKFRSFHYDENYQRFRERWQPHAAVLAALD